MPAKSLRQHDEDVSAIQSQLRAAYNAHLTIARTKDGDVVPHCTRPGIVGARAVSIGKLKGILGMEEDHAWVEPGVTMEQLCRWTLERGLIPPVVPEFRGITVGGAVMGAALESSSFRYGQFSDICDAYDILLGDGRLLRASAEAHPDIFYGVSGSYGSLGTLAAVKVRLIPAGSAVRVSYHLVDNLERVADKFEELARSDPCPDYLDAVAIDAQRVVVMAARQEALPDHKSLTRLGEWWRPWFIQHLLARMEAQATADDYFSLEDYLFRYDRSAFWMGQFCTCRHALFRYLTRWRLGSPQLSQDMHRAFVNDPPTLSPSLLFRLAFGRQLSSKALYKTLHLLPTATLRETFHVQDFYVPAQKLTSFLKHLSSHVQIYPLWLCPVRGTRTGQFLSPHYLTAPSRYPLPDFVNVGVYGIPGNGRTVPEVCRELEALTHELGGRKMLYALNSIPEEEFWRVYDRSRYDQLRKETDVTGVLAGLYDKVCS